MLRRLSNLNAGLTNTSPLSSPTLTASLPAKQVAANDIATIRFRGFVQSNGTSSTSQITCKVSIAEAVSNEPELANAVVVDSANAEAAIKRFRTVSISAAAAACWYWVAPAVIYDLGTHRAFKCGFHILYCALRLFGRHTNDRQLWPTTLFFRD